MFSIVINSVLLTNFLRLKNQNSLSLYGLTMIAIGACIGSGIFVTPAQSVAALPHYGLVLITWGIGGLVSCLGALTFSELGARYPNAGGVYVYLKEAFGPLTGFLYGWITLLIVNTGALAALSITLADYFLPLVGVEDIQKIPFSIGIIWVLTIVNIFGVKISEWFSNIFTGIKVLAIILIILAGFYYALHLPHGSENFFNNNIPTDLSKGILITFVGVFWSMGGWHHASYLAGEARDPSKTVPRAMILGTLAVTVIYVLVIFSYMLVLPMNEMSQSSKVASDMMIKIHGSGGLFVSVSIIISILGTIGIYTMTAPRIYFAMARDKIFFSFLAKLHPKFKTPVSAMIFQSIWATILILAWGSFLKVITFVTFMDIVFMALASTSLFIVRSRNKTTQPVYLVPFYPIIPIIYLSVTTGFVLYSAWQMEWESWSGIIILALGIPVYYWFRSIQKSNGI